MALGLPERVECHGRPKISEPSRPGGQKSVKCQLFLILFPLALDIGRTYQPSSPPYCSLNNSGHLIKNCKCYSPMWLRMKLSSFGPLYDFIASLLGANTVTKLKTKYALNFKKFSFFWTHFTLFYSLNPGVLTKNDVLCELLDDTCWGRFRECLLCLLVDQQTES